MNIFLGIRLGGANLGDTSLYIMIVYAVGVVVVIVLSEYLSLKTGDKATYMAANKDGKGQWALLSTLVKLTSKPMYVIECYRSAKLLGTEKRTSKLKATYGNHFEKRFEPDHLNWDECSL